MGKLTVLGGKLAVQRCKAMEKGWEEWDLRWLDDMCENERREIAARRARLFSFTSSLNALQTRLKQAKDAPVAHQSRRFWSVIESDPKLLISRFVSCETRLANSLNYV